MFPWTGSRSSIHLLTVGQSTGIGYAIVEQLAAHGAKVYLAARSEGRAKAAIKGIEDAHPQVKEEGLVVWLRLDLTEPADVVESAKVFIGREQRLDILGEKEDFWSTAVRSSS